MKYLLFALGLHFCTISVCLAQGLPIKPARTISFTTDEGTNMDVDISPDGRTIVFDLLGDLFTVPSAGGTAIQLTRGLAINFRPVWSPDGTKIAYISDASGSLRLNVRDLSDKLHLVLGRSDEQLQLFYDMDVYPVWTADGNYISIGEHTYDLYGGKLSLPKRVEHPIRFSSDGKSVYYRTSDSLYRYDREIDSCEPIPTKPLWQVQGIAFSPDGHWYSFVEDSNLKKSLILHSLVDNSSRMLAPALSLNYPYYKKYAQPHYAFSPDSKSIVIGFGGKLHRIDAQSGVDRIIPFTAKINSDLGALDYNTYRISNDSLKVKYLRSANASPDNKHLVFSTLDKIYVMDLPSGRPYPLIDQPMAQFQPVYSPDGKWIAYVTWSDTAGGQLWRVPAAGGSPEQLTREPGQYQQPAWSPDGTSIAIVKGSVKLTDFDNRGSLELIPINGGAVKVIEDTVPLSNQLTFSGDGRRLIYESVFNNDDLRPELVSKDLDGQHQRLLAVGRSETDAYSVLQRSISPDGRYIVYSMGEDLYLFPVCQLVTPIVIFNHWADIPVIRFAQGVDPHWEQKGKALCWTYGNSFFSVSPEKIIAEAQKKEASSSADSAIMTLNIHPDREIKISLIAPHLFAHGMIALRDVRVITMQNDKVIEHGTILIKDGRFVAIGPTAMVSIPAGAKQLDLAGTTVMPGFVDMHLHFHTTPDVFLQQSWKYLISLAYGVTTARDPATNIDSYGYKQLVETGHMVGPRVNTVGRSVYLFLDGIPRVDNAADANSIVRKRGLLGSTFIKQYLLPSRLQKQWLLQASEDARLNMTNEGEYYPLFYLAMLKDGGTGIEHAPEWGDMYKDITNFIAGCGTYLTPTLQIRYGMELFKYNANDQFWRQPTQKLSQFMPDEQLKFMLSKAIHTDTANCGFLDPSRIYARIRHAGGRVLLGSHGDDEGIGVHNELWALQMGGLTNLEALQAATIMGAEGLGLQKDLGSIEVGKIADLIVLNKNPLDDIHNSREIRYVMKDGVLYDGNTLDTIWPFVRKCPEWRFGQDQHPLQ